MKKEKDSGTGIQRMFIIDSKLHLGPWIDLLVFIM